MSVSLACLGFPKAQLTVAGNPPLRYSQRKMVHTDGHWERP